LTAEKQVYKNTTVFTDNEALSSNIKVNMLHTTGFLSADENDLEQPVMVRNKNLSDDIDIFLS